MNKLLLQQNQNDSYNILLKMDVEYCQCYLEIYWRAQFEFLKTLSLSYSYIFLHLQSIINHNLMNRVIFNILQEKTSINYHHLKSLENTNHLSIAFSSEQFPIYPLVIHLYLQNPPFNKFSIVFSKGFIPKKGSLHGSEDGLSYQKFHEMNNLLDRQQEYTIIFKQRYIYNYIKIILEEPGPKTKINFCHQIKIRGIEFNLISFYNTRYVCSLLSKLSFHPLLFRLLEVMEYKYLLLKANNNKLYEKYLKRMEELSRMIENKKIDIKNPSPKDLQKWKDQINYIESEPNNINNFIERPDPIQTKEAINNLMKDIQYFAIDRVNNIKPEVREYFGDFENGEIQQRYLKQISSSQSEDHNKALVAFWNDTKKHEGPFEQNTQKAILTFFNYFLENQRENLIIYALKILILFHKINSPSIIPNLEPIYLKIFRNIIKFIHQNQNEELYNLSMKYCYLLFDRINHQNFVEQLLKDYNQYDLQQQIQILGILEKLTFRNVKIQDKHQLIEFIIHILMNKQIQLGEKNRAYNILAYLACIFGKEVIMKDCEKLNSMILMTMEKTIDNKMGKILKQKNQQVNKCQYCGIQNPQFKDENLYDLHLAKQCKYISNCKFCGQNIETPELFKHYIEQCQNKNQFKHCQNCFQVIELKQEQKHNTICERKLSTKCPLCYVKVDNKLRLKEHLIVEGCPNNFR